MNFARGRPDILRAINQRWLFNFWQRSLAGRPLPRWAAVESENLSRVAASLSFLDVNHDDSGSRFRIFSHGATIAQVYGMADCRGLHLDEVLAADVCTKALQPYHRAVHAACPIYTIYDVVDRQGRIVQFERLLLPFSREGGTVDRLLASFEFVCLDGGFESRGLMSTQTMPPILRVSATIN